jgi:carbonic anhydrase
VRVLTGEQYKVEIQTLDLRSLFPSRPEQFYRYLGSVTTTPCSENVIWTVFAQSQTMSQQQVMTDNLTFLSIEFFTNKYPYTEIYFYFLTHNNILNAILLGITNSI